MALPRSGNLPAQDGAVVDQVSWSSRVPGHRILVWYEDDDVWHERVLLWPSHDVAGRSRDRWVVLTPDDDVYVEDYGPGGVASDVFALRYA